MVMQAERRAYSVAEVAKMAGLTKVTVLRAVHRNELPSFRLGTKVLIPRSAVERLFGEGGGEALYDADTNQQ